MLEAMLYVFFSAQHAGYRLRHENRLQTDFDLFRLTNQPFSGLALVSPVVISASRCL